MTIKKYINSNLFSLFSEENKKELMKLGQNTEFLEKKCLFRQGDIGECFYFIRKGYVTISITSNDGKEIILNRLSGGEVFGEIAMFDQGVRTADAFVEEGCVLMSIKREDFFKFLEKHPHLYKMVLDLLCQRLRWCSSLLEDFLFQDTMKRLICRLVTLSEKYDNVTDSLIEVTQDDLAKMLGTSREVVNRNLQFLQDKDLLRIERKKIFVPDVGKLKMILKE
jgi:CRP/FNR family cyclic AMP-dependent transcriptional regulator